MDVVKRSKYRHVYGKTWNKWESYTDIKVDSTSGDSTLLRLNSSFFALPWATAGKFGRLLVVPIGEFGRVEQNPPVIEAHNNKLSSFDVNPFTTNVIVTSSTDGDMKLWNVPEDGLSESLRTPFATLSYGASRRVTITNFHPFVSNLFVSCTLDRSKSVLLWDVNRCESPAITLPPEHTDAVLSSEWNGDGNVLATACKDKKLRLFDPRANGLLGAVEPHVGGSKGIRCVWIRDKRWILTSGYRGGASREREIALWDVRKGIESDGKALLSREAVDHGGAGALQLFYDQDTGVVYACGKGDGLLRYFEVRSPSRPPTLMRLGAYKMPSPSTALAMFPKLSCDAEVCEIARFLKLGPTSVENVAFTVPRKHKSVFHEDLYPETFDMEANLDAREWLAGDDVVISRVSLRPEGFPSIYDIPKDQGGRKRPSTSGGAEDDEESEDSDDEGLYEEVHVRVEVDDETGELVQEYGMVENPHQVQRTTRMVPDTSPPSSSSSTSSEPGPGTRDRAPSHMEDFIAAMQSAASGKTGSKTGASTAPAPTPSPARTRAPSHMDAFLQAMCAAGDGKSSGGAATRQDRSATVVRARSTRAPTSNAPPSSSSGAREGFARAKPSGGGPPPLPTRKDARSSTIASPSGVNSSFGGASRPRSQRASFLGGQRFSTSMPAQDTPPVLVSSPVPMDSPSVQRHTSGTVYSPLGTDVPPPVPSASDSTKGSIGNPERKMIPRDMSQSVPHLRAHPKEGSGVSGPNAFRKVSADPLDGARVEGWLKKLRPGLRKVWDDRWFALSADNSTLYYFTGPKAVSSQGGIAIADVLSIEKASRGQRGVSKSRLACTFTITVSGGREYVLQARDPSLQFRWLTQLKDVHHKARRSRPSRTGGTMAHGGGASSMLAGKGAGLTQQRVYNKRAEYVLMDISAEETCAQVCERASKLFGGELLAQFCDASTPYALFEVRTARNERRRMAGAERVADVVRGFAMAQGVKSAQSSRETYRFVLMPAATPPTLRIPRAATPHVPPDAAAAASASALAASSSSASSGLAKTMGSGGDAGKAPLEGFLLKKSPHSMRSGWQKRWFACKADVLYYYDYSSSVDSPPVGNIHLDKVLSVRNAGSKFGGKRRFLCFEIDTGERAFFLQADSKEQRQWWVKQLNVRLESVRARQGNAEDPTSKRTRKNLKKLTASRKSLLRASTASVSSAPLSSSTSRVGSSAPSNDSAGARLLRTDSVMFMDDLLDENPLEGYLMKQGEKGLIKGWKNRWFSLKGPALCYTASPQAQRALGSIPLARMQRVQPLAPGAHITGVDLHDREYCFTIQMEGRPGRTYRLMAQSQRERDWWVAGLNAAAFGEDESSESSEEAEAEDPGDEGRDRVYSSYQDPEGFVLLPERNSLGEKKVEVRSPDPQGLSGEDASMPMMHRSTGDVDDAEQLCISTPSVQSAPAGSMHGRTRRQSSSSWGVEERKAVMRGLPAGGGGAGAGGGGGGSVGGAVGGGRRISIGMRHTSPRESMATTPIDGAQEGASTATQPTQRRRKDTGSPGGGAGVLGATDGSAARAAGGTRDMGADVRGGEEDSALMATDVLRGMRMRRMTTRTRRVKVNWLERLGVDVDAKLWVRTDPRLLDPNAVRKGSAPQLLRCVGSRKLLRVDRLPFPSSPAELPCLDARYVYVVDAGSTVYQWNGALSTRMEKVKGLDVSTRIRRDDRHGQARLVVLNDGDEDEQDPRHHPPTSHTMANGLWDVFRRFTGCGDKHAIVMRTAAAATASSSSTVKADSGGGGRASKERMARAIDASLFLYRVVASSKPERCVRLISQHTRPSKAVLSSKHTFVLDARTHIYVWTGAASKLTSRRLAMRVAQRLLVAKDRPAHAKLSRLIEGGETALFKEAFADYPGVLPIATTPTQPAHTPPHAAAHADKRVGEPRLDVEAALADAGDGGGGEASECPRVVMESDRDEEARGAHHGASPPPPSPALRVWRVAHSTTGAGGASSCPSGAIERHPVCPAAIGQCWAGEAYLVHAAYTDPRGKSKHVVYHWHGRTAQAIHKGSSALMTVKLDEELARVEGAASSQFRVVQHKEPVHFTDLFCAHSGVPFIIRCGSYSTAPEDHQAFVLHRRCGSGQYVLVERAAQRCEEAGGGCGPIVLPCNAISVLVCWGCGSGPAVVAQCRVWRGSDACEEDAAYVAQHHEAIAHALRHHATSTQSESPRATPASEASEASTTGSTHDAGGVEVWRQEEHGERLREWGQSRYVPEDPVAIVSAASSDVEHRHHEEKHKHMEQQQHLAMGHHARIDAMRVPMGCGRQRLLRIHAPSGAYVAQPVANFSQDDLDQDRVMLLHCTCHGPDRKDEGEEEDEEARGGASVTYVWFGSRARGVERRVALEAVQRYVAQRSAREAYVVKAYHEPYEFARYFPSWDSQCFPESKRNLCAYPPEELSSIAKEWERTTYPYDALIAEDLPDGVDATKLEQYLDEDSFSRLFQMDRREFLRLPSWKQQSLKKRVYLY